MAAEQHLFQTQRSRVIQMYKDAGQPFVATTTPYKSVRPIVFTVVNPLAANANAFAVARIGQQIRFFNYGIGDAVSDGFGGEYESTEDDTNQGEGDHTNGSEDFVIEGFSLSARSKRILYANDAIAGITDEDVRAALFGINAPNAAPIPPALYDPAALVSPPQQDSPFNLEEGLFRAMVSSLSVEITFDRRRIEPIGTAEQFPEGAGKSYLKANGEPSTNNRYRVPEGFLWRRSGQPDSQMNVVCTLQRAIVVPLNIITAPGGNAPVLPQKIAVDLCMRVHGLAVDAPSNN